MSDGPEDKKTEETTKDKEETVKVDPVVLLTRLDGVGPKTAEKFVAIGYDALEKIISAEPEAIAEAVPGISAKKAEDIIKEANKLLEAIKSGAVDITGKSKKSKRKKTQEPEPERVELPPAGVITKTEARKTLTTGHEQDKKRMGIPVGPMWLTKFEKARIIGARALQISMGAPVMIDMSSAPKGLFALAEAELESGILPMTLRRTLPTGEFYDIPLSTLLEQTRLG
jgi:DNA-directed RNA polymerase I, II, and III subunit RPABC2/DNA-directed RNA polymerase subunit K